MAAKLQAQNPQQAKKWLLTKLATLKNVSRTGLLQDPTRARTTFDIGRLYFFAYDPKTKETLPYWDKFPLVFPIDVDSDGFLGINLHYLPPKMRLALMDELMKVASNKALDYNTRLRLSYTVLNRAKKFRAFRPCLKKYLAQHVISKFISIESYEWYQAVALPFHNFEGAPATEVWRDSMEKIT